MTATTGGAAALFAARPWLGIAFVLAVATSFGFSVNFAKLAILGGSNALSINTMRVGGAAMMLYLLLRSTGVSLAMPPGRRALALAAGLLHAAYGQTFLLSLDYLPVGIAVITFYTYPLLAALATWAIGRERPRTRAALALVMAFVGLALALKVLEGGLSAVGIALAFAAAVGVTVMLLAMPLLASGVDSRAVTLHFLGSGAGCFLLASLVTGGFAVPETADGRLAFLAAPFCYVFGIVGFYWAAIAIGAIRTALVMNFEPVSAMALGFVILGERLDAGQVLGAAVVVAAIVLISRSR
ncbi:MAG: DMT family transporter [Alphaproteobacteria bacterium]|nr:DMT family transporter [Alphaproteobacteria bacterium]